MNLNDIKKSVTPGVEEIASLPPHVLSFCALLVPEFRDSFSVLIHDLKEDKFHPGHYGYIAFLGFALVVTRAEEPFKQKFIEEIDQLKGRKFFTPNKVSRFEIDSIALLGVASGLHYMGAPKEELNWFLELLKKSEQALEDDLSQLSLIQTARVLVSNGDWSKISDPTANVALTYTYGKTTSSDLRQAAWDNILDISDDKDIVRRSLKRAVFENCAHFLSSLPIRGAGVSELKRLLINVSESMSHWTFEKKPRVKNASVRKWHIDHEYHVQNLLWTILKPIFPDLIDEGSLPKVGHKTPRYDLGIPSLQTIIEVKFMKKSGQHACAKIIEEIAADSALYLTPNTGYETIIAFIWDNCVQTEEYSVLKRGIESLDGVEIAIILPRPHRLMDNDKEDD